MLLKIDAWIKRLRKMTSSFLSTNEGERYLKGLHRRDSCIDLRFIQGRTEEAYNGLVCILRNRFKQDPSKIEHILREMDLQELRRFQGIAFDCASYEEFVEILKAENTEN